LTSNPSGNKISVEVVEVLSMPVTITIPDSIVGAIKMPEAHLEESLREELAVRLYADGALSFGKARELADAGKFEFGQVLAKHGISRHYTSEELEEDLKYAGCQ
jgi:predicted HTH domain antitoxin